MRTHGKNPSKPHKIYIFDFFLKNGLLIALIIFQYNLNVTNCINYIIIHVFIKHSLNQLSYLFGQSFPVIACRTLLGQTRVIIIYGTPLLLYMGHCCTASPANKK